MIRHSALRITLIMLAALAASLLPGRALASSEYVLAAGDVLSITVFGDPELATSGPVGPDGLVSMPLVGQVLAAGRTAAELKATIERLLLPYIKDPRVNIVITSFRPLRVAVMGEVARPGSYQLPQGASVTDALAAAGDITAEADADDITLVQAGVTASMRYADIASSAGAAARLLYDGATVFVPRAQRQLLVLGDVVRPGPVPVPAAGVFRLLDAVAAAGGVPSSVADLAQVRVDYTGRRGGDAVATAHSWSGSTTLAALISDPSASANVQLMPGDAIIVQVSPRSATVIGEVAKPGVYPLKADTTLLSLLAAAGGLRPDVADAGHALLTTADGASRQLDLGQLLNGSTPDVPVAAGATLFVPALARAQAAVVGEVARPGVYEIRPGATLAELVAQAGGLTSKAAAKVLVYGERSQATPRFEGDAKSSILVEDRDLIVVESRALHITVLGSVARPGSYELLDGATVLQALAAAGGLAANADGAAAVLTRSGEPVAVDLSSADSAAAPVPVAGGDVLFVPAAESRALVIGQVARPGAYALEPGARAMDLIAAAGGVVNKADKIAVYAGGDMSAARFEGSLAANPPVGAGDIVEVKANTIRVAVLGSVARPGSYELLSGAGIVQALATAGGITPAANAAAATLTRDGAQVAVKLDVAAPPVQLVDGDVLFVPQLEFKVTVTGQVARPGMYELKPGARAMDLIAAAGGALNRADKIAVYSGGDMSAPSFEGSVSVNPAIEDRDTLVVKANTIRVTVLGSVARPGMYELPESAGMAQALAAAGGLAAEADGAAAMLTRGGQSAGVDLSIVASTPYPAADGDVLFVPRAEWRALVIGQVARAGEYEVRPDARAIDLIAAAGGVVNKADRIAVYADGDMAAARFEGSLAANPPVSAGDIIEVKANTIRVAVLGSVARPGSYELLSGAGIVQALAAAGGVAPGADAAAATLTRDGAQVAVSLDVAAPPVQLVDGDVLFVPQLEFMATVMGQVARPGAYELKPGARAMDLIAAAGGVLNKADKIAMFRSGYMTSPVFEGGVAANPALEPGDTLVVKANTVRVTVLGKVARPGTYELPDSAGLVQALAAAGGLSAEADGAAAMLTRAGESVAIDLNSMATPAPVADGDVLFVPEAELRVLVIGQVARPGAYGIKPGARAMDLIAAAGGAVNKADKIAVYASGDMAVARFGGSLAANPPVSAGDIIEVKPNIIRVTVLGSVARPGSFELQSGAELVQALAAAGGVTPAANVTAATLTRDGSSMAADLDVTAPPVQLADGDVLFVPQLEFRATVMGQVARPGAYELKPGARAMDLVAAAGGVLSKADKIAVYSGGNMAAPSFEGHLASNPAIEPGDTLVVKANIIRVTVLGQVARSGSYELPDDAGFAQVLAAAGGAAPGADVAAAMLTRGGQSVAVDLGTVASTFYPAADGDVLFVPELQFRVMIIGQAARPGSYDLKPGARALDLVAAAGGVVNRASQIAVFRDGNMASPVFQGALSANPPISAGDIVEVMPNTIRVTVLGKVARPGTYELPSEAAVSHLLAAAGGIAVGADEGAATLTREGRSLSIDLRSATPLSDGDLFFVPELQFRATVIGQVARPGAYDLKPGARAMDLIAAAGGVLDRADRIVIHASGDMAAARFEGALAENPSISAGDIVEVRPNTIRVTALGKVARPGTYELPNDAAVSHLLAAAGGVAAGADDAGATLTHEGQSHPIDLHTATPLHDGDLLFLPELQFRATAMGQVARPGAYDLKPGARALDLVAAAGGVVNRASQITVFRGGDMASPVFEGEIAANPAIEPGDALVLKANTIRVTVLGKVARPGTYELPDDATVSHVLAAAGGVAAGADTTATVTRGGQSHTIDLDDMVPVADGDVLLVPELQLRAVIIGQVARPAAYDLKPGARAIDLIAAAGGVLARADRIAVFTAGDMAAARYEGALAANPLIDDGDIVEVKPNTVRVTVLGKVARPGSYELAGDAGQAQALAAAGGLATGADSAAMLTRRDGAAATVGLDVGSQPVRLADGDVLFVPELERRALVMGQVARPGSYEFKTGARALDLIAAAGGVLAKADSIAVFRDGGMASPVFEGVLADNPIIQPGDTVVVKSNTIRVTVLGKVARPGSYELPDDAGVVQVLAAAGGLAAGADGAAAMLTRAGQTVGVDLDAADLAATRIPIVEGDVLFVPELEFRAVVIGRVARPGAYDMKPGALVLDLVAAAGGALDGADQVTVRAASGAAAPRFEGALAANPAISPGDVVEVMPNTLRVTVLGEVARPGSYELKNTARLVDALAAAGGLTDDASGDRIAVYAEGVLDKPAYTSIESGSNPTVADGDVIMVANRMIKVSVMGYVARPGVYELAPDADLARALATAGGATREGDLARVSVAGATGARTFDATTGSTTGGAANAPTGAAPGGRGIALADGDVVHVPELITRDVLVFGEVARPGAYKLAQGARLLDAIAAAGGATREASLDDVTISRDSQEPAVPVFSGRVTENPQVNPGDVVHIGSRMISVTVMGKAARPGTYKLLAGSRVIDALAAAGGIAADGDRRTIVVAPTAAPGEARSVNLDEVLANPASAAALADGDVVMVPELRQQLAVMGEVTRPGVYTYSPGVTVLEALALAGGFTSRADLSKIRLYRAGSAADAVLLEIADERLAFEGDIVANPALKPGDILMVPTSLIRVQVAGHVARPGEVQLRAGATVLDAIAAAGGLTSAADGSSAVITARGEAQVRRADIDALLAAGGSAPAVREGDVIFVPESYRKVTVMGAVARPGLYDYKQGMRLIEALAVAGGPSVDARLDKVLVYSGDAAEQVALGAANAKSIAPDPAGANNPALRAGDIVIVPQSDKIDWTAVSAILAIANSVKNLLKW